MVLTNQLIYLVNVKTIRRIFSNYVSFSKSLNFKKCHFRQFFREGWDGRALLEWHSRIPHWIKKNPFVLGSYTPKGQLISKCLFGLIVSTKTPTKEFDNFCPCNLKSGEINKIKPISYDTTIYIWLYWLFKVTKTL